jgi:hypothetical protein
VRRRRRGAAHYRHATFGQACKWALSVRACGQLDVGGARPYAGAADTPDPEDSMAAPQARPLVHADIKPVTDPALASHYIDAPNMPWEATKFPGIRIKVLYSDDSGVTTALFKLEPGAVVPLHDDVAPLN